MEFGDVNSASGLEALDRHLADKSYIEGYVPTQVTEEEWSSIDVLLSMYSYNPLVC